MTYNKTTWKTGDTITADKLNNLENGVSSIDTVEENLTNKVADLATMVDNNTNAIANIPKGVRLNLNNPINFSIGASGTKYNISTSGQLYVRTESNTTASGGYSASVFLHSALTGGTQYYGISTSTIPSRTANSLTVHAEQGTYAEINYSGNPETKFAILYPYIQ